MQYVVYSLCPARFVFLCNTGPSVWGSPIHSGSNPPTSIISQDSAPPSLLLPRRPWLVSRWKKKKQTIAKATTTKNLARKHKILHTALTSAIAVIASSVTQFYLPFSTMSF